MERKRARLPHSDSGRLICPNAILTNHGAAAKHVARRKKCRREQGIFAAGDAEEFDLATAPLVFISADWGGCGEIASAQSRVRSCYG